MTELPRPGFSALGLSVLSQCHSTWKALVRNPIERMRQGLALLLTLAMVFTTLPVLALNVHSSPHTQWKTQRHSLRTVRDLNHGSGWKRANAQRGVTRLALQSTHLSVGKYQMPASRSSDLEIAANGLDFEFLPPQLRPSFSLVMNGLFASSTTGANVTFLGPQQFDRTTGPPDQYNVSFSVPPYALSPYQLIIHNGDLSGNNRISSSWIYINGAQIAGPSDFNPQVATITRQITLNSGSNTLYVKLASQPGSYITLNITGVATVPVANAGPPQTLYVGSTVQLDGSASYDPGGLPLTYQWSLAGMPAGSAASLNGASTAKPMFVADKVGTYTAQLIVNNGYNSSTPATVTITSQHQPPVANAGQPQMVYQESTVQLNGASSYDPAELPITYQWSFVSVPQGSNAGLNGATTPLPTFVADKVGNYVVQLVVNNGFFSSAPSTVTVSTLNAPPVANAGPNQTVNFGATVQLNGSRSTDVDGDAITYAWSFVSTPTGSQAVLLNPSSVTPTFTADKKGNFVLQLVVNDGVQNSTPSTVTITTLNSPPVANAGPNQTITVTGTVQLNGSGSTDVDGDPLTYAWSFLTIPTGSTATLSNPNAVQPTFVADQLGTYVVQLIVNDGTVNSIPATVTITSGDVPPMANPGPAQSVFVGSVVNLDGSASMDSDNQPLTYNWSLLSKPAASAATLSAATSATPYFIADVGGDYVVQLIVSDGFLNSNPVTVMISTIDTPPVANAGPNQTVTAVATVQLDGSASKDEDGDALTYQWAILSQPTGGAAVLSNATLVNPIFVANMAGLYVVQLIANDGRYSSPPVTMTVTVNAPPPVVSAGPNLTITLPTNTVTLNGSATDVGLPPTALTLTWSMVSGPGNVSFGSSSTAITQATFSAAGTYVIQLTANNGQASSSSTATVTVNQPLNQPPVVNAGPNQTIPFPNTYPLQGSVSSANTPPGKPTAQWTRISGPPVTFANPTSPTSTTQVNTAGTYVLQLTGTENGISSSSQVTIIATAGNLPPVVNAGPDQTITLPVNTVALNGSATDPQGSALSYSWTIVSGSGTASFTQPTSASTGVSFSAQGNYTLRLTASDSQLSGSADVHITVLPQNDPPVVNAGPDQTITLPVNVVLLTGMATDDGLPAGSTLKTTWSFISGPGAVQFGNSNSLQTTALFAAVGTYDLRLTADDSQYRTSADLTITVNPAPGTVTPGSIVLTPSSASPVNVGTAQQFQATVHDGIGAPVVGATVMFAVAGVNQKTGSATTDSDGNATFSYSGTAQGLDEVTASEGSGSGALVSNSSPVNWVLVAPQVSTSSVTGQFFTSDGSGTFDTSPSAQPVFAQTFASINFNPPAGTVPGAPSSIDVTSRPFTYVSTDSSGNFTGSIVAQGNGSQAGVGTLAAFQADFTGTFTVAAAGNVTFNFLNADGFVFGVGNSATRVSGTFVDPPNTGVTVFHNYPVMGSFNTATAPVANTITVHFPAAGSYPFEIDYAASSQNALIAPGSLWKYSLTNPTGFEQPGFDDTSFAEGFAPFTNAIGAQSPGFGCPLIGATLFPVFGTVDLRKTILLPAGASNVTAYVAIDNDFTLWINGTLVTNQTSEGCAFEWNRTVPIPDSFWVPGQNLVAFQARDRGGATGFETQLIEGATGSSGQAQTKGLTLTMNVEQDNSQRTLTLLPPGATSGLGLAGLCGAFTDSNGNVIEPIAFGAASHTFIVPPNATQLQLGIDDDKLSDNTGSGFVVNVDGSSVTVPPTAMPWRSHNGGLNTNYLFGISDGTSPVVAAAALVSGQAVTIAYQSGTVSAGPTFPLSDANGDSAAITDGNKGSTGTFFPTEYMNQLTFSIGQQISFKVVVTDISGALLPNQSVTFNVAGVNTQQYQTLTDNTGTAYFAYHGFSAGADVVQAQALVTGALVISNQTSVIWNKITNQPPMVSAGANQTITLPSDTVTLMGTATDDGLPNGTLTYTWTQTSGPTTAFVSTPTQLATVVVFTQPGVYAFQVTASDSILSSSSTVQVTVSQPNQPPVINIVASTTQLTLPANTVTVTGTVTDDGLPSGSTVTSQWGELSGPGAVTFSNPTSPNTIITFPSAGSYVLQLAASDTQLTSSVNLAVTVNAAAPNQPPVIKISASTNNLTLPANTVTITGTVTDDGLPVGSTVTSQWGELSGPGAVSFSNPASPNTTITFPVAGSYVLQLSASDTQLTSSVNLAVTVSAAAPNQPPSVTIIPSQTSITLPSNVVRLAGNVTDDGLPIGGKLTAQWSQLSGPLPATFSSPNTAVTQVGFPAAGVYVFQLSASDSQLSSSATVSITVNAAATAVNQQPTVAITATQTLLTLPSNTTTLNGIVNDDGLPNGTISVQWAQTSGPAAANLAKNGPTSITAAFPAAGVYVIQITASDSQLSSSASISITVTNPGGNQPPTVNAGQNQTIQSPQNSVTLDGYAADDGLPEGSVLTVNWSQISGPTPVSFSNASSAVTQASFSATGVYVLQLAASDTQLQSTSEVAITVANAPQTPPAPPVVNLTNPAAGADITQPSAVAGTVTMETGTWTLAYSLSDPNNPNPTWITIATGTGAASGTLGTLDPSLLLNGIYNVQLTATDNFNQSASIAIPVQVVRNLKVGNFSITFSDLSVPLPGLPIQIARTYDSRNKSQGDFGIGWTLSVANVRLQVSRSLAKNWSEDSEWAGLFPQYCLTKQDNSFVTATFPDGRVYKFQPVSSPQCQNAGPITAPTLAFTQLPTGSNTAGASLVPADGGSVLIDGSVPGPENLIDYSGNLYNPTQFLLTTADGFTYTIDETLGVTQVKDLNGNTLTINTAGVISSSGKSVAFTRDGQGRITQIQDPAGNSLSYSYDSNGNLSTFTDCAQNVTTFTYDSNNSHYLLNISDPRGGAEPAIKNTYDATGRLLSTTDENGKTITYSANISANTDQITDRLGNITTYVYDGDGNILSMTDALGNTTTYTYDANDDKLTETNPLGKTTTYTYDAQGNRLTETDPLGNTTNHTYNARGQVLTVTDPQGHLTTNVYDSKGNLTSTTDANGKTTTTVYGANGLPSSVTDAAGNTTQFQYDGSGNLTQQTDAAGNITTYTYDANGNKLSQTVTRTVNGQPQTLTTGYKYDADNRLTETDYPDGTKTQVQYNNIGKQSATIDQLNRKTTYTYDNLGRLTTTTYPDNTTETATYDAENHRLTSTDRAGHTTSYTYDADGRLIKTTYTDQSFTQTNYDAAGRVSSTVDADGNTTTYGYDDAGRRTSITDALNHVTAFTYDAAGNQTAVKDANQHTTQYQYDSLNRQVKVIYPDQTFSTTAYDTLGRVIAKTDQAGKITGYGYDTLGRLTSVTQDDTTGGLNLVTTYGYDEVGNRISQTDANGHTTTYSYDQLGRRLGRALPLGQSESYTYDAAGNLKTHTDFNGKTTTYAYDSSNRLLSKAPDASFNAAPVSFTYTNNGLRATMTDPSGTTTYTYDTRNHLTQKQTPEGTLSYTYDAVGNLLTFKSSNAGGTSDTYTYDVLNRLSTVADASGTTTYGYDAVGNLSGYTYPNGVVTSYNYDSLNRLTQMGAAKGGALSSYTYALGPAGNRTSMAELSGRTVTYGYDSLYRLTSEAITSDPNGKNGTVSYAYDSVGNRQQMNSTLSAIPAGLFFYNANDQLSTDTYDANGNTISSAGIQDSYDFENHLIEKGAMTVVYDGDGNRVSETAGGVTTNYLVDTANPTGYAQVVDELQGGVVSRTYSYGLERISETQASGTSFYGYDGHGSVRQLINSSGTITDTYTYDAFGSLINSTGTTTNNYLFAGEQYDPALGLYYNRARYLNTSTGRFWSMDTDEGDDTDPLSLHKYIHTEDDPVDNTDKSGNEIDEVIGSLGISDAINAISLLNFNTILSTIKPETLYLRAFAPWKTFGFGFGGDNRSFTTSTAKGVTSRIVGTVQFALPTLGVLSSTAHSDPSYWGKHTKTGHPTITATGDNGSMHVDEAGSNPLVPGAPDIDVHLDMTVKMNGEQACYSGNLTGDQFPDEEVFVVNRENDATMLQTFATNGGRQTGPFLYLAGNGHGAMGSFSNKCVAP